ncbi:SDR family oxidoreductase [Photobacterium sp. SDRW27]|uniref:SDR family oxidoreductase n=1 Tax=Photobacterium obscurum TaxID=2829490 RepID=UPI0022446187|nr:SDR family oxidoreductase [Photobacterium obscurum]MCW8327322.1 SDR family oxidoreductase [Photobacterium obscurum]
MKVSICGCGWLGLPLAKQLVRNGDSVFGSRREPCEAAKLVDFGIHGVALTLPLYLPDNDDDMTHLYSEFFDTDVLVINVPPGRGEGADERFIANVQSMSYAAQKYGCRRVIFISTTSVYGDVTGEVEEGTVPRPNTASGHAHWYIEQWLQEQWGADVVILRFAGLIGPGRHPVKFLSGRKGLINGSDPVNLIHLDDCIQAIGQITACWPSTNVLHLSAPSHPTRREYYTAMALTAGLPLPEFTDSPVSNAKVINGQHTCEILDMTLQHPNLMLLAPELI